MALHMKPIAYEARHWPGGVSGDEAFRSRSDYSNTAVVTITHEMTRADISLTMSRAHDRHEQIDFYNELSADLLDKGVEFMTWRHNGKTVEKNLLTGAAHCGLGCKSSCEYCAD